MGDTIDSYRDQNILKMELHKSRRETAKREYSTATQYASRAGFQLLRCTDAHYQLIYPNGPILNVYPGNCRLLADKRRKGAPFIRGLPDEWTLIDIVSRAVDQYEKKRR